MTSSKRGTAAPRVKKASAAAVAAPEIEVARGAESDEPARYSWTQLAKKIQPASKQELEQFAIKVPVASLVELGATVRSERILTDGLRWLGQIVLFWTKLDNEGREAFVGFSDQRLRVLYSRLLALKSAVERNSAAPDLEVDHVAAVSRADAAYKRGQRLRAITVRALEQAASSEASLAPQIVEANTSAQTPVELIKTLRSLATLVKKSLANESIRAQLEADGVHSGLVKRLSDIAAEIERGADSKGAHGSKPVPQSEIDRLDGECLLTMKHVRAVFAEAKLSDPRVPTLTPLSTRSALGLRADSAAGADEKQPPTP